MGIDWDYERSRCWSQPEAEGSVTMNRDHQRICPRCGTSPLADDVRCWNCDYPLPKVGDSTPPATPVKTPEEMEGVQEMREHLGLVFDALWRGQFDQIAQRRAADQHVGPVLKWLDTCWPPTRVRQPSHPPAVSGEGDRQGNYYGHRLTAGVSDGRVVIAVGVETLAHAVAYADWSNPFDDAADEYIRTFAIADAPQFAKDMVSAMLAEREDGSTPLSEFLDRMARAAIEDGSLGLDDAEYRIKHGEHAPCETWARASTPTPGAPR